MSEPGFYIPPDECDECGEDFDLCECPIHPDPEPDPGEAKEWEDFDPDC